ncbi:TPA: FAD-dependent monooxygenase [Pseudomonas putida]|nr:FAD-dependent monooxygenase [Pseudomonas putida]
MPHKNAGRIALLGDAAFVARPHCGMGVAKATGDAVALVAALDQIRDVAKALEHYSEQRTAFGTTVVLGGKALRSNEPLFFGFLGNGHSCGCLGSQALGSQHVVSEWKSCVIRCEDL